uniref:Uncharacterized protein n=1 Tax=Rhizophora mucronata TaxID=61149 RepID=A0A2P2IMR0_RHIMU
MIHTRNSKELSLYLALLAKAGARDTEAS